MIGHFAAYPRLREAEKELAGGRLEAAHRTGHPASSRKPQRAARPRSSRRDRVAAAARWSRPSNSCARRWRWARDRWKSSRTLASVMHHQERLGRSAKRVQLSRAADRRSRRSRGAKALILDKLGRNDEALRAHEELVAEDPDRSRFWIGYGHSLRAAGRTDDAVAAYRRAISNRSWRTAKPGGRWRTSSRRS